MAQSDKHSDSAVEKINFISSPVHSHRKGISFSSPETTIRITKTGGQLSQEKLHLIQNNDATNLEVFYDLFLACLELFAENQQLNTLAGLSAYIGFFCLLWTTWFLTTMYDVRFLMDSIFERCARGVHLGVLIGFVTVSPNFDPGKQDPLVFKTFTIILMASRLCLALEYGTILFHLRHYKSTRLPLAGLVTQNFLTAMIYLGVAFRFRKGANSHVFSVWYITAISEIGFNIFLSHRYHFLSFHGTYMMKRIGLLTCIFFGEGVASACAGITKVVKVESHADVWTSQTIGTVTACVAIIYIVFMIYSDWVHKRQLPGWRQITWTLLHFPLHLVMSLFMEGCTQFIIFWKLAENTLFITNSFQNFFENTSILSSAFLQNLTDLLIKLMERFPPTYTITATTIDNALADLGNIDLVSMSTRVKDSESLCATDPDCIAFQNAMNTIFVSLGNSLYNLYGIDFTRDIEGYNATTKEGAIDIQEILSTRNYGRLRVVFQYTFVCAGFFLGIANLISVVSRTKRWTRGAAMYHAFIFVVSLGIGLVSVVSQNYNSLLKFQITAWILPTLLLTYFLILAMNHVSSWLAARRDRESRDSGGMESQPHLGNPTSVGPSGQQYTAVAMAEMTPYQTVGATYPTVAGSYIPPQAAAPYFGVGYEQPQDKAGPLAGELRVVDISAAPPYEALSYTWGAEEPCDYLWLGRTPLPVKPNLEAALRALRLPTQTRRLWIDALCIDQSNIDERSRQVQYMRLVYKHAARVIMWLGLKTPGVEQAFELARLYAQARAVVDDPDAAGGEALDAVAAGEFVQSMLADCPPEAMQRLSELFDRPYWTRTWCIQEVVAASWTIVLVEDLEISFIELMSTIQSVLEWRGTMPFSTPFYLWSLIHMRRHPRSPLARSEVDGSMGSILDVLEQARAFQATDVRDKIFALLGISDEGLEPSLALTQINGTPGPLLHGLRRGLSRFNGFMQRVDPDYGTPRGLRPDYKKDPVMVFTDLSRFMMRKSPRMLDVLGHVDHHEDPSASSEYPSWVPRWFEPRVSFAFARCFLAGLCDGHFRYFAELHDSPLMGQSTRPKVLSLDGFRVGAVEKVSEALDFFFTDDEHAMAMFERIWAQLFPFPMFAPNTQSYHRGEPLEVALCNALAVCPLGIVVGAMIIQSRTGRLSEIKPPETKNERGAGPLSAQCQREIGNFLAQLAVRKNSMMQTGQAFSPSASSANTNDANTFITFMAAMRTFGSNRRAFVTRDGRIGLGPKMMRPGDEVVSMFGGRMPFIIRPQQDHHLFVGSCYLRDDELMWGTETEKIKFKKPGALPVVTFELR